MSNSLTDVQFLNILNKSYYSHNSYWFFVISGVFNSMMVLAFKDLSGYSEYSEQGEHFCDSQFSQMFVMNLILILPDEHKNALKSNYLSDRFPFDYHKIKTHFALF